MDRRFPPTPSHGAARFPRPRLGRFLSRPRALASVAFYRAPAPPPHRSLSLRSIAPPRPRIIGHFLCATAPPPRSLSIAPPRPRLIGHFLCVLSFIVSRLSLIVSCLSLIVSRLSLIVSRLSLIAYRFSFLVSRFSFIAYRFSFLVYCFSFFVY